jgi:hypothetical protein
VIIFLFIFSISEIIELTPQDSLLIKDESLWEKLSFGVGYLGGICWASDPLMTSNAAPLDVSARFYWSNSIEGSLYYTLGRRKISLPLEEERKIVIGVGYGWVRLNDRRGLSLYLPNDDPSTGEAYVDASDWNIRLYNISFKFFENNSFYLGGAIYYCTATTEEYLTSYTSDIWLSDTTAYTKRNCIGGGVFCGWEGLGKNLSRTVKLKPFLQLQLGWANEYENDSPWEWDKKLKIHLSGVFIGIKFEIGN